MNDRSRPKAAPETRPSSLGSSLGDQPTLSGIDRAIANSDEWQLATFLEVIERLPAERLVAEQGRGVDGSRLTARADRARRLSARTEGVQGRRHQRRVEASAYDAVLARERADLAQLRAIAGTP